MPLFRYSLVNLGCRLNQAELTQLEDFLQTKGGAFDNDQPNLIVVNTCAVTIKAERESRGLIRRLRRQHPKATILLWGCAAEKWLQEGYNWKELGANYNLGNQGKNPNHQIQTKNLFSSLDNLFSPFIPHLHSSTSFKEKYYLKRPRRFLKIQDGCNHFCSYCLIPYLRHRSTSKPAELILQEINSALKDGVQEIILTGVDIADYKWKDINLAKLITLILEKTSLPRLRLGSINPPALADGQLAKIMAKNKRFLPHLHISLQSGSDKVLQLMKRGYSRQEYLEWVGNIQKKVPSFLVSTDVIVGFPGEEETDFIQTVELIKEIKFSKLHIFPFSPRPNTLINQLQLSPVPQTIIKKRVESLQKLNNQLRRYWFFYYQNKTLSVLWESYKDGFLSGWTENYLPFRQRGNKDKVNRIEKIVWQPPQE